MLAVGGAVVLGVLLAVVGGLAGLIVLVGLTVVTPGEAQVLQFFGRYTGAIRTPGLRWVDPVTTRKGISTRIRNHESDVLTVNDRDGSTIEIAAGGRHGEQPARGAVRRSVHPTGGQRGFSLPLRCPTARASCCASTRRFTTRWPGGRRRAAQYQRADRLPPA